MLFSKIVTILKVSLTHVYMVAPMHQTLTLVFTISLFKD
jgi:hypothetical protein